MRYSAKRFLLLGYIGLFGLFSYVNIHHGSLVQIQLLAAQQRQQEGGEAGAGKSQPSEAERSQKAWSRLKPKIFHSSKAASKIMIIANQQPKSMQNAKSSVKASKTAVQKSFHVFPTASNKDKEAFRRRVLQSDGRRSIIAKKRLPSLSIKKSSSSNSPAIYPEDSQATDRILEQMNYRPQTVKSKTIKISLREKWNVVYGQEEFLRNQCFINNCEIVGPGTTDADAIIFRTFVSEPYEGAFKRRHKPDQLWIYYNLESPKYGGPDMAAFNGQMNWTATYRWDSDIVTPYERFTPVQDIPEDQRHLRYSRDGMMQVKGNYAKHKSKMAAWFVSHCATSSSREGYVKELQKYIDVDIFGSCGTKTCRRHQGKCSKMLDQEYRFYIAFENSLCQDYITEKYYINALANNVIPIVMGGTLEEYRRVSPPNSFIHVDEFPSPEALANYLIHLASNESAYNQYFRWKGTGNIINTKFWCRLCAMLNNPRPKIYENFADWWKGDQICRTPKY